MANKVRLGSIGLGWWGGVLAKGASDSGLAEVVTCYARSPASREAFSSEYECVAVDSLDELLGYDIDGVLIATPHTTHAELAVAAASSGKHIFVDKPLTLTVKEADDVIAAAENAAVILQVGHNRRRQPANRAIRDWVSSGELGEVHHLLAVHSAPLFFNPNLSAWRQRAEESPAGGMTALGVHQVDTFQYLAGPIARVMALSRRLLPGKEVDDTTVISFEFESGALGQLATSQATGPTVDVEVHGTKAIARNLGDGSVLTIQRRGSWDTEVVETEQLDTIRDEMAEFARGIRGEARPETGGSESRSVVAVLEAIIASANEARIVDV